MARRTWALAAVAVVALVIAGAVQAGGGWRGGDDEASTMSTVARDSVGGTAGSAGASASSPAFSGQAQVAPLPPVGGQLPAPVPGAPRVVHAADVRVKVAEGGFGAAFDRVASVAAANGGFVSSSTTSSFEDARSGELTVRVPADRFDSVRLSLAELGDIESQSIRGEDVSGQLVDFEARLRSLEAQEGSLLTLVGRATAVGEVLQVQSTLFNVRQQIEQLKAQKANLEQETALATIQVALFEPGAAGAVRPLDGGPSLTSSFEEAIDAMVSVVGGMIVVAGHLVPVIVLGLVVWGAGRVVRRRPAPVAPAAPAV